MGANEGENLGAYVRVKKGRRRIRIIFNKRE